MALAVNYFAAKYLFANSSNQVFLKTSAVIIAFVAGSIFLSGKFYDVSFDGQWYHMETVIQLKQGYNPAHQELPIPADEIWGNDFPVFCNGLIKPIPVSAKSGTPRVNLKYLNINNLDKGTEVIEAAIYGLTNRIETAKAVNVIMLLATLMLCVSALSRINPSGPFKNWALAALFAFNPITLVQLNSFCVDGNVACSIVCLFAIACMLFIDVNRYFLFALASAITLAVTLKYTNLVYVVICLAGFLLTLIIYKKKEIFKKTLVAGAISVMTGVLCCGYHPYVTNYLRHRNIFYGLHDTRDEIKLLTPHLFLHLNRFETLFLSLTSRTGWYSADKSSAWQVPKIPFTFTMDDIHNASDTMLKLSGMGPFFSGVLLVTLILLTVLLIRFRKNNIIKYALMAILVIFATIAIVPDPWWARFVPQLWLFPLIVLLAAEFVSFRGVRLLKGILYLSLVMSVAWGMMAIVFNVFSTARVNYQMAQLKALHQPVRMIYCRFESFKSNRIRFAEDGIPVTDKEPVTPNLYNVEASNTVFETSVPLPDLPKPYLLRLSERIKAKK
ncbi:MAG TPA: hypothetical protein VHC47_13365 [Mucilaginibacter sp.]|nr:hypothetical protein [Mucilaginibacter sp.]